MNQLAANECVAAAGGTQARRWRRHRDGFTLIELLVVMTIISILAAMLLPVLAKSMEAARSISCCSNLKQLNQVISHYEDDHSGYLPHPHASYMIGGCACAHGYVNTLAPYVGMKGEPAPSGGQIPAPGVRGIFVCPKAKSYVFPTTGQKADIADYWKYGWSRNFMGASGTDPENWRMKRNRYSKSIIMMADGYVSIFQTPTPFSGGNAIYAVYVRHGKWEWANYLFTDSHVESSHTYHLASSTYTSSPWR